MNIRKIIAVTIIGLGLTLTLLQLFNVSHDSSLVQAKKVDVEAKTIVPTEVKIMVDDFSPQRLQGDPVYYYNRLGGDRGALGSSELKFGMGPLFGATTWTNTCSLGSRAK